MSMSPEPFQWAGYDANVPAHRVLLDFLVLDVQYSSRHADELHAAVQAWRQGAGEPLEGSGNGYEFECRPEGFWIDCLYEGDPLTPVLVDYATLLQALGEWSQHCQRLEAAAGRS